MPPPAHYGLATTDWFAAVPLDDPLSYPGPIPPFSFLPLVILEHVNRMADAVAPHWPRPQEAKSLAYRVEIDGRPNMRCELSFDQAAHTGEDQGLIATAMRAINAIPAVRVARSGILSPLDLPVFSSRNVRR